MRSCKVKKKRIRASNENHLHVPSEEDAQPVALQVTRGFGGTGAVAHKKNANVFSPLFNSEGYPGGTTGIRYNLDPSSDFAAQVLVDHTLKVRSQGFAGSWFDCFDDTEYNAVDCRRYACASRMGFRHGLVLHFRNLPRCSKEAIDCLLVGDSCQSLDLPANLSE